MEKYIFKINIKIILKLLSSIALFIILYHVIALNYHKRVGVISLYHSQNVGNFLVKYSMFIKLKEFGFKPIIISTTKKKVNLDFLNKNIQFKIIKNNFSDELNENNFDFLIVNSDQTWNSIQKQYLYDYGFLKFAENWKTPKFIYATSLGVDYWKYSKNFDKIAKRLLKNFTGISVREIGAVNLVEKHLGIKPVFVLDPTFLIEKKYYLNLIKDYKKNFNLNLKYLFIYQLDKNSIMEDFINRIAKNLNFTIYRVELEKNNFVENFIFGINISSAVITDSFHGTLFSIIFNKPFISFINTFRGRDRFFSLIKTFNLKNRIIFPNKTIEPNYSLLTKPLNLNRTLLNYLKNVSINYLKKNLHIN